MGKLNEMKNDVTEIVRHICGEGEICTYSSDPKKDTDLARAREMK